MLGPQGVALLGVVALVECVVFSVQVCTVEEGFVVLYAQAMLSVAHSLLLPADQDVELSAPSPAPCLPAYCHASNHDDNKLNL